MKNRYATRLFSAFAFTSAILFSNASLADIEGVWRGTLEAAPGSELLVEFTIASTGEDTFSVVLNTPELAAIKDVAATDVSFTDDTLTLQVEELNGSFSGKLEAGILAGTWSQPGGELPFQLSPYVEPTLSAEHIASIVGKWQGTISRGDTPIQAVIWRFEVNESGELIGYMGPASRGTAFIPMQNIAISDSAFSFTVNDAGGRYTGRITNGEVLGNWSQQGQELALNMIPREDDPLLEALSFSPELVANVAGEWEGTLVIDAARSQDVLWRFESTEPGQVTGFMGPAAQGVASIPMQNIVITETELSFDVFDAGGRFSGRFSDDGIEGTWNQGLDMSITMTRR